jgi:hypothetical protein
VYFCLVYYLEIFGLQFLHISFLQIEVLIIIDLFLLDSRLTVTLHQVLLYAPNAHIIKLVLLRLYLSLYRFVRIAKVVRPGKHRRPGH